MMASKKKKKSSKSNQAKTAVRTSARRPAAKAAKTPAAPAAPPRTPVIRAAAKVPPAIRTLLHKINGKLGEKDGPPVVSLAGDVTSNAFLRRPSGIMQLDVDCGGGIPAQEMTTIGGPSNAGKSTLMYCYFAQHQRIYGDRSRIGLTHSEGNIDYKQARRCGWIVPFPEKEIEAEQYSRATQGYPLLTDEEIADMRREVGVNVLVEANTMESILDATLMLLESNEFHLIGLDSYEGLIPNAEAAQDSLEEHAAQALRANLITRFCQRYYKAKKDPRHFTSLIVTTQVRSNRKKMEASPFMQKYIKDYSDDKVAYALQHARALHISLDVGGKLDEGKEKGNKNPKGKLTTWCLRKGKSGAHDNVHGETPYYYDHRCFEPLATVVTAGIQHGVIRENKGQLTFYRRGEADDYLFNIPGKSCFMQAMEEDPSSEWAVRYAICRAAGVSAIYDNADR